jgi:uncharacterized protein YbjT (DUF2867 family)
VRILVAGASGVLGRATLPHLDGHDIVGLTRTEKGRRAIHELGAEAVICDVYDHAALLAAVGRAQPQTVVNFLTDLAGGSSEANARIRRVGSANLLDAAVAANASRLIVESVAFPLEGDGAAALEELEGATAQFPGDALVLRFGLFWGPGTFHETEPPPPSIYVDVAGERAAGLITAGPPGTHVVSD